MNDLPPEMVRYVEILTSHGGLWIYMAVALAMILEYIIPPIPGDVAIFAAGFLAGTERASLTIILLAALAGSCVGYTIVYTIGERYGRHLIESRNFWFINRRLLDRTEAWYKKFGGRLLIVSKFLPGVRFALVLFSGIAEMPFKKVFVYTGISCIIWNSMVIILAFGVQKNINELYRMLSTFNYAAILILAALVIVWLAIYLFRKRLVK